MAELLKLAIIGDPHLAMPQGGDDALLDIDGGMKLHRDSALLLRAAISAIAVEPGVAAVLLLGDMTRDSERFNHEAAAELLSSLPMQVFILAGNHDYARVRRLNYEDTERLDKEEFAEFWRGRGLPDGSTRYKAELPGGVDLIVLDTNLTGAELAQREIDLKLQDHGYCEEEQLEWLETQLAETRSRGRLPVVAAHHSVMDQSPAEAEDHPLVSIFGFWQVRESWRLRAVLKPHNVPLVLSGHLHVQSVNSQDGVTNVVTSALVSYPHKWGLLTIESGRITYEARRLDEYLPAGFVQRSCAATNEGIGQLIAHELRSHPLLGTQAQGIADMVVASEWWPRLCDGTLAGFKVDPALMPKNPLLRVAYGKVAHLLNEYGDWKSKRGDPNCVVIAP
jgi:3',5'-cyclic AMP phosphodiesterase CpdA